MKDRASGIREKGRFDSGLILPSGKMTIRFRKLPKNARTLVRALQVHGRWRMRARRMRQPKRGLTCVRQRHKLTRVLGARIRVKYGGCVSVKEARGRAQRAGMRTTMLSGNQRIRPRKNIKY